jgi:hypothetical protein
VPAHRTRAGPSSGAVVEPSGRRPRREHQLEAEPAGEKVVGLTKAPYLRRVGGSIVLAAILEASGGSERR